MATKKRAGAPAKRTTGASESENASPLRAKAALLAAVVEDIDRALAVMRAAVKTAHEAATHAEMKPENDKDTRGLEAGYLAAGQAERAKELTRARDLVIGLTPIVFAKDARVAALALVDVKDLASDERSTIFVVPVPGGKKIEHGGRTIALVSPSSPLGDALFGKRIGDVVEVHIGARMKELEVVDVT